MDEILQMFIEDTKEHLDDIEANLMDMELAGANIDEETVNKIFRAAHSIKGGAGFLKLENIRDLSHKLENILHMIRNRELVPDNKIVSVLLGGFDRLAVLCEHAQTSDNENIQDVLDSLKTLTLNLLPKSEQACLDTCKEVKSPGLSVSFQVTELDLNQALKGGKYLYLVEYDLIQDVQAKGKTPLEVISAMESAGLILDSKVDFDAVGVLDETNVEAIPFIVLYSTIIEPDLIGHLFSVNKDRITRIDSGKLPVLSSSQPTQPNPDFLASDVREHVTYGDISVDCHDQICLVTAQGDLTSVESEELLRALRYIVDKKMDTHFDLTRISACDLMCLQLLMSAGKTFRAQNKRLTYKNGIPQVIADQAALLGIHSEFFFA